jgi:hypothetical protein
LPKSNPVSLDGSRSRRLPGAVTIAIPTLIPKLSKPCALLNLWRGGDVALCLTGTPYPAAQVGACLALEQELVAWELDVQPHAPVKVCAPMGVGNKGRQVRLAGAQSAWQAWRGRCSRAGGGVRRPASTQPHGFLKGVGEKPAAGLGSVCITAAYRLAGALDPIGSRAGLPAPWCGGCRRSGPSAFCRAQSRANQQPMCKAPTSGHQCIHAHCRAG